MDKLKLQVNYRADMSNGRMKQIRRQGYATGSICGHDSKPISVEVKMSDLVHQVKNSTTGLKSIFDLDITGAPEKSNGMVIIKDYYKDPITRKMLDIQFQRVSMTEKIHVGVAIKLVGNATACLRAGGMIEQTLDELQILCLPSDIPDEIEVDVSGCEVGDIIHASDIKLKDNIDVLTEPDTTVIISRAATMRLEPEAETAEAEPEASE